MTSLNTWTKTKLRNVPRIAVDLGLNFTIAVVATINGPGAERRGRFHWRLRRGHALPHSLLLKGCGKSIGMKLIHMDEAYWAERRIEAEREFPGSSYGVRPDLTAEVVDRFEDALHAGAEEAIQVCLAENPYLVQYAIPNSGHHGTWVYPKQMIRPKAATGEPGLIPDFLAVTRSSLGDHWWVVELKRFDTQFADAQGAGMSPAGHKAVSQAAGYLAHFRDYIDAIRSHARIPRLTQPAGALILIGDSRTESETQRTVRSNFVRTANSINVASYRRIVVNARGDVGFTRNSRPFSLDPA